MTTIITTASPSYATMFADQGITSDLMQPDMGKIVQQGTWLIGVCGESRVCDLVQYVAKYPKVPESLISKKIEQWYPWIVTRVIPIIQKAVEENINKSSWSGLGDSEALLVTHGHSFLIGETLGLSKAEPYWGIGSGAQLAIGSLIGKSHNADWNTKHAEYAKEAILAAEVHDPYTRGKVTGYKSLPSGRVSSIIT